MKILLTGATGYFGSHLKKHLEEISDIFISNTQVANLLDIKNLYIYNDIKFDYIFHLAALTGAGDWPMHHKADQFEINQLINSNIMKYWHEFHPQAKFIAIGTSCSYTPDILMKEDNYLIGEPDLGLYTYAMIKRMILVGLRSYAEQYGLKYMYYIPSTLYGPGFKDGDNHFILDLIRKIYAGKHEGSQVALWGDGYQRRELIYIDDVVKIILSTIHLENQVLNLGTGNDNSIREFAGMVSKIIGYDETKIFYDLTKYVGVRVKKIDTKKLFTFLPDFQFTPLSLGLQSTINYYERSHHTISNGK